MALDDLEAGKIGLVIKLFPVISWLTRERPDLAIVMQMPTHERLGIAYAPERADFCDAVDAVIEALRESGELAKLQATWQTTGGAA
jgi:polar amino acid transport system substrate-binding protein